MVSEEVKQLRKDPKWVGRGPPYPNGGEGTPIGEWSSSRRMRLRQARDPFTSILGKGGSKGGLRMGWGKESEDTLV